MKKLFSSWYFYGFLILAAFVGYLFYQDIKAKKAEETTGTDKPATNTGGNVTPVAEDEKKA